MNKIILLYDFLKEIGGLERVLFFQANLLKDKYDSEIVCSYVSKKNKNEVIKELELNKEIKVSQLGSVSNEILQMTLSFLFPRRARKLKTDLIISHSFMSSRMAHLKKKLDGTPYVVILYHPPNFVYSNIKGWANNLPRRFASLLGLFFKNKIKKLDCHAVKNANLVIAISEYTAKRVKKIYGLSPVIVYPQLSKFFTILKDKKKEDFLSKHKINRKFLLAHGRVIPDKNYEVLLYVIKLLENVDLIISGSITENYRKELEDKIIEMKLQNRVKVLGKICKEDLLGYYNCAELFLMPAKKEDFGLTPIEAMACGCPVIAWCDDAGPNETIISGVNGLLAKPYNIHDFADKIKIGLKKKWNKKKMIRSVDKFSEKEVGENFTKIIDGLFHR